MAMVALNNAIRSVPPGTVILERSTVSDYRQMSFLFVLRLQTEAEEIIQELIPFASTRLNKHLAFRNDVQQIAWCVRSIKEFDWDFFFPPEDTPATAVTTQVDAHPSTADSGPPELGEQCSPRANFVRGSAPKVPREESRANKEARIAELMARYAVAHRFHMTLSTLAGIRGYGSYYPELPCVSAAMSESLQKWPAAAAVLDRDEKITAKVMETLEDDDFDRKRAYVFHRSVAETEDATNVEDGTDGSSPARETMFCYIVE